MTTITITISIDAGDDARVTVGAPQSVHQDTSANGYGEPSYVPPFQDELVPLPDGAMPLPNDPVFRGAATAVAGRDFCPIHHLGWKEVPAGVSKKTGKPYAAFKACPERGCDQRP